MPFPVGPFLTSLWHGKDTPVDLAFLKESRIRSHWRGPYCKHRNKAWWKAVAFPHGKHFRVWPISQTSSIADLDVIFSLLYPSLLVGDGAKQWAQQHGLPLIESQTMKTGFSIKYQRISDDRNRFVFLLQRTVSWCSRNTRESWMKRPWNQRNEWKRYVETSDLSAFLIRRCFSTRLDRRRHRAARYRGCDCHRSARTCCCCRIQRWNSS